MFRIIIATSIRAWLLPFVLTCGAVFAHSADPKPVLSRFEFSQPCMGTTFRITLYAENEAQAKTAADAAFRKAHDLDAKMSDYKPDSELMKLSAKAGQGPVVVSEELFDIIEKAQDISHITDGAFDITVGPVVKLWRLARRTREMPPSAELKSALSRVGYQKIDMNRDKSTIELKTADMKLDLGGIAKGYAADALIKILKDKGCPIALVAAGGDIVAGDAPPGKKGWYVEAVDLKNEKAQTLCLKNNAASTSGDLYQSVEIQGKTYSHIVDPKTGLGLTNRNLVTIIAPTGTAADALATALAVMDPDAGIRLMETTPPACYRCRYILLKDGRQIVRSSEGFSYHTDRNRKE